MTPADARDRALEALLRRGPQAVGDTSDCLDAETLAAWAEHALSGAALERAEAHMAGCARCQAAMATLVTSLETTPAGGGQTAEAPARSWWSLNLRWLVPLAGAAAAAVLWAVVPSDDPRRMERVDVALGGPPAAQPQAASVPDATTAPVEALRQPSQSELRVQPSRSARASGERAATGLDAPTAPPAAPPPPAAAFGAPREADARAEAAVAPPAELGKAAIAVTENRLSRSLAAIRSGDPSVQWRLAGPGVVERSRDAGESWERLDTGTPFAFAAGAAPQADVCWLVGANGVVLLTSDARTWRRVATPAPDDLVGVEAASNRTATVRTASGAAFQTSDGGAQWTRVP